MMSSVSELTKDRIYERVQRRMRTWYGTVVERSGQACLYYMHAGIVTLRQCNIHAVEACGSAHWQCQPDNGKDMTHFGFEWGGDPDHELRRQVITDKIGLPEMHCWIWLPQTQEVVDFSAGFVPTLAKAMGFEWKVELPPPYYWAGPKSLFPRAVYIPNRDATQLAVVKLLASQKGIQ